MWLKFITLLSVSSLAMQTAVEECTGQVGSKIIFEDTQLRLWNFTLAPGESSSMHTHKCDYYFAVTSPSRLAIFDRDGGRISDSVVEGVLAFKVKEEMLVQTGGDLVIPRTHAVKNEGSTNFNEILIEIKSSCVI